MRFIVIAVLIISYLFAVGSGAAWVWSLRNDLSPQSLIFLISSVLFLASWAYIKADKHFHFTSPSCKCQKEGDHVV